MGFVEPNVSHRPWVHACGVPGDDHGDGAHVSLAESKIDRFFFGSVCGRNPIRTTLNLWLKPERLLAFTGESSETRVS